MADFDFIPINTTAEKLEKIANMDINEEILDENSNNSSLPTSKIVYDTIKELGGGEVDQTYDPKSENAQSGKAVKEATSNKLTLFWGEELTRSMITEPNKNYIKKEVYNTEPDSAFWKANLGDIYVNPTQNIAFICTKQFRLTRPNTDVTWNETYWSILGRPNVDQTYASKSKNAQSGLAVAEAINKIIGDIGDEQTVAEMFFSINETLEMVVNEYVPVESLKRIYFNITKVLGVLGEANPYFADSILYANAEGNAITACDIKIDDLRNAINDIANLKTTTASKEYVDGLVGDINEALETALNGGM